MGRTEPPVLLRWLSERLAKPRQVDAWTESPTGLSPIMMDAMHATIRIASAHHPSVPFPWSTIRGWWPAMWLFWALFVTWDAGAISLFLGAIVPLHVIAFEQLFRLFPASVVPFIVALSRVSLLLPVWFAAST